MAVDAEVALRELASRQDGLVTAAQALTLGYSRTVIGRLRRSGRWRVVAPGVYLIDADLVSEPLSSRVWWRAALLFSGPRACLVASSALRAYGVHGLPFERCIEVGVIGGPSRHGRRPAQIALRGRDDEAPDLVVRQYAIGVDEIVMQSGLPVRRLEMSLVDTALEAHRGTALALLDSVLHQRLLSTEELRRSVVLAAGRRGVVALRALAELADPRAESQVESRVRLACIDGKVPPDELQFPVYDTVGNLLAIGDMAWLKGRHRPLIAEADGESVHSLPEAVYRDRRRGNALVAQACDTIRFTYADALRPAYVVSVVRAALAA